MQSLSQTSRVLTTLEDEGAQVHTAKTKHGLVERAAWLKHRWLLLMDSSPYSTSWWIHPCEPRDNLLLESSCSRAKTVVPNNPVHHADFKSAGFLEHLAILIPHH